MLETTIKKTGRISGVGLHSGRQVNMTLLPAGERHGIVFKKRIGGEEVLIPALHNFAEETNLCTMIKNKSHKVHTIEHLMAALNALDVDNVMIEIDGDEVPILDGSAKPFIDFIEDCGIRTCKAPREYIQITNSLYVQDEDKTVSLDPASDSLFSYQIDFQKYPVIGTQNYSTILNKDSFIKDISYARTFGFYEDVEMLKRNGLARGGSLDNSIVLDKDGKIMNQSGLRHKDEFVRHKVLDAIGDIKLAGRKILGHFNGIKASHRLTLRLLKFLFAHPECWRVVTLPAV